MSMFHNTTGWGTAQTFYPSSGFHNAVGDGPAVKAMKRIKERIKKAEDDFKNGIAYDSQYFLTKYQAVCTTTYPHAAAGEVGGKKKAYMECMNNAQKTVNEEAKLFANTKSDQGFNQTITAVLGPNGGGDAVASLAGVTGDTSFASESGSGGMNGMFIFFALLLLGGAGFYYWYSNRAVAAPIQ